MELLTSPKSMYLLDAGLEILHEQSVEWLNEVLFWRDESAFFYSLIVKKTLKSVPVDSKNMIEKIENELLKITGGDLDELEQEVEEHEHYLYHLMGSKNFAEKNYRTRHEQLASKFSEFEKRFKTLKKAIFSLSAVIDKNKS